MAEGLAVAGIVANIVQLVDFGSRVLERLQDFQSNLKDIPETYRHVNVELPVLLDALRKTKVAADAGRLEDQSRKALLPAIQGCWEQIKKLDGTIARVLPLTGDSSIRRRMKAARSVWNDSKVEKINTILRGYIDALTFHAAVSSMASTDRYLLDSTPCSTIPFRRDPHFIDRQILPEVFSKSQQAASRVALVGLGGVGKSQLAVEYAYQIREKSPDTWIFWVSASSRIDFEESYWRIAERTKPPGWDKPNIPLLKLVYDWLCDETHGRWVMIIDNADKIDLFPRVSQFNEGDDGTTRPGEDSLLKFLPQSTNGSILITSRNMDTAFRLTGDFRDIIRIGPMNEAHALSLLRSKMPDNFEPDDEIALVKALDYMPLAITQAAAYISQRAPRSTVSTYLRDIQRGNEDRANLLELDMDDLRRDGTASNSITATWQISIKYLSEKKPSAMRLLSLMSLFDQQGIPEYLLRSHYHEEKDTNPNLGDTSSDLDATGLDLEDTSSDFEDDLNTLMSFSFVTTDADGGYFKMHRLVQYSTKKWLELHDELESWKIRYVKLIDANYPPLRHGLRDYCPAIFPHALEAIAYRPRSSTEAIETWASVLSKATRYAFDIGNHSLAEPLSHFVLEGILGVRKFDDCLLLECLFNVAVVKLELSKLKSAELFFRQALRVSETILGSDHIETLGCFSNLGLVLARQGKYDEAEEMHRKSLKGIKETGEIAQMATLTFTGHLANALSKQGKNEDAEEMLRLVMQGRGETIGEDHISTLLTMHSLGQVLSEQGKHQEAEKWHRKTLKSRLDLLGPVHPHTLTSLDNLGRTLAEQGKYEEAEVSYREALDGFLKVHGANHENTLNTMDVLARALAAQCKYEEAEALNRRALDGREKVFGSEHEYTLSSMESLARALAAQDKYEEAEALSRRALDGREKVHGLEYEHTLDSMDNLARLLLLQGRDEGVSLMEKCIQLRTRVLGAEHESTILSRELLTEHQAGRKSTELAACTKPPEKSPSGAKRLSSWIIGFII